MTSTATTTRFGAGRRPGAPGPRVPEPPLRIARTTGLLYLGLGLTGMLGFLLIRPLVFTDDGAAGLGVLADGASLARLGLATEMGVVLTQALAAVWFYRLFRRYDAVAAGALAAFGLVNAVAILASVASLATALDIALDPVGNAVGQVGLLVGLADNFWLAGSLFFGLWLVPMGMLARRAGMPRTLGWILVVGGVGYVLSAFVTVLAPDAGVVGEVLVIPATVGEFWMIGYLLHGGVFRRSS